jgi:hypothetical protein
VKVVAVGLAAVAAVLIWKSMSTTAAPARVYYPQPAQAPARHWYDTTLGVLGTVAGNALGSYIALAPRNTGTPVKSASGGTVNSYTSNASGSLSGDALATYINGGMMR